MTGGAGGELGARRLLAAVSVLLSYPDESTVGRLDAVTPGSLPEEAAETLRPLLSWMRSTSVLDAQAHYVEIFDRRRRACLYLSYFLDGDTRRRGMALVAFKDAYQRAGLTIGDEELPDFLPVVLELGAVGHLDVALELLARHRSGLEVLAAALDRFSSPYAAAVHALLPVVPEEAAGPTAQELALSGPPVESVGLAPFIPLDSLTVGARS